MECYCKVAAEFPTLGALAYFKELGSEEAFAEDMREYCYLVKKAMEKRSQLMSELGKLAVSEGAAGYLETLKQRQNRDTH
ncbi:hypothetical protein Tco_0071638 [Tanacetum coccineum]